MKKITEDELNIMIEQHQLWLDSHRYKGKRFKFDLPRVDLNYMSLAGVNLQRAYLTNCDLLCSDFSGTNLSDVNLSMASLIGCNFQDADLSHANLYGADLRNANLLGCNLLNANLNDTDLRGTKFDHGILECYMLTDTLWLKSDIPWYIQHPHYHKFAHTIEILNE